MQLDHGWSMQVELIDGEPVLIPPDHPPAATAQGELFMRLRRWQETSGDGGRVIMDVFVAIDGTSTLGPDVAWWSAERRPPILPGYVEVIPDWVAEVLSPSTRENDLGPKRERYLAAGVRELWLVDPAARSVTIVAADGTEAAAGERCVSSVLDGFELETASLFVS